MPRWIGFFDNTGAPSLKISVGGPIRQLSREFDAVIDTGFSGFISMPLLRAFPIGLMLFGTTAIVLADGTTAYKLTALGTAAVEGESRVGVIILEPTSNDILIGMEFLRQFNKNLFVDPDNSRVILEDTKPPASPPSTQNPPKP
jgi:predicted aspartyl protease